MTDTKRLRDLIAASGLKYAAIAEKLRISAYSLQKKIENDSEFKVSEVNKLAEILGMTLEEKDQIFFSGC